VVGHTHRISLTTTNSLGLSASTTMTVQVGDSLDPLGPTLLMTPPGGRAGGDRRRPRATAAPGAGEQRGPRRAELGSQ
jgi:hypothetical protein